MYSAYSGQSGGLSESCILNAGQALNFICSVTLLIESKKIMKRDSAPIVVFLASAPLKCTYSSVSGLLIPWC